MQYLDRFDRPTDTWRRGVVTASAQPGPIALEPNFRVGHVTLAGTAVHPDCLRDFEAALSWAFGYGDGAEMTVALGKPHEWGAHEEAALRIKVNRAGQVAVTDAAGRVLLAAMIDADGERLSLTFGKQGAELVIRAGDEEQRGPWPGESGRGGYLMIEATGGAYVFLHRFALTSPHERAPLTAAERQADIDAWLRGRMDANHRAMRRFVAEVPVAALDGVWGYRTDLAVSPGLVRRGERVRVVFTVKGALPEPCTATVEADYLGANAEPPRPLDLAWWAAGGGWQAEAELVPDVTGNWRVVWQVGAERLSRVFGVIEPGYAVCTLWVGSNFPDIDAEIHQYDLPGDYWIGDWWSPYASDTPALLDYLRRYARMRHHYGDRLVPFVNATWMLPHVPNFNLMALSADLQAEGLEMAQRLWDLLGVGPLELLASYTFGHATPQIARRLGIKAITSLCTWQNWLDGADANAWKINHWAAPNAPYFVAEDDFRKVAPGPSILAFSMGMASSVRNYCIFTMEGCPTLTSPMQRYRGGTAQSVNITRFYDAVDVYLHDATYQPEPLFFTVGLENFVRSPDWAKANALAVDYLAARAKSHRLVFASAADIADYYHRHYPRQPEHVYYQPDIYAGYRVQSKPAQLPDRIETSNAQFHTLHVAGQALPQFFWDFTRPWAEPEWDDQADLRDQDGLIIPEHVTPAVIPRQVDLSGAQAETTAAAHGGEVAVTATFRLPRAFDALPVAVWRVPLAGEGLRVVEASAGVRWITVVDGVTGNVHGLMVCEDLPAGGSTRRVRLAGTPRAPQRADFSLGDALRGRTIRRDGAPYTYLWRADGVGPGRLAVRAPQGGRVEVRYNDGQIIHPDANNALTIAFTDDWTHEVPLVVGMDAADLQAGAHFERT